MKKRKQKTALKKTALKKTEQPQPDSFEKQMNKIGITKIKKEKPFNIKEFLDSINLEQPALRIKTYKGMKFLL